MKRLSDGTLPKEADVDVRNPLAIAWYAQAHREAWHEEGQRLRETCGPRQIDKDARRWDIGFATGKSEGFAAILRLIIGTDDNDKVCASLREHGIEPI